MHSKFGRWVWAFWVALVTTTALGCTAGDSKKLPDTPKILPDTLQAEPYINEEYGFSIHFPKNFTGVPQKGKGTLVLYRDATGLANINLRSGSSGSDTLATVFAQVKASLPAQVTNAEVHGDGETTIDSVPAKWVDLSHSSDGNKVRAIVYIVVKGGRYFMTFCTASEGEFERHRPAFRDSAESLEIK